MLPVHHRSYRGRVSIEQELYVQMDGHPIKRDGGDHPSMAKALAVAVGVLAVIALSIILQEPFRFEWLFSGSSRDGSDDDDDSRGGPPSNAAYA
jgi:hypothetical protein